MINAEIIHPEILKTLAAAGHGSTVLIADGHFPVSTGATPETPRGYLNFAPDLLNATDVLKHLVKVIPVEAATVIALNDGSEPPIFPRFRELLPAGLEIGKATRFDFYDAVNRPSLALVIATGETRTYANILLTIGVRKI